MSHDIERILDILYYCEAVLDFRHLLDDISDSKLTMVSIDTGVFGHIYKEDRNYDRKEDIFVIKGSCGEIESDDIVPVLEEIKKYIVKFERGRSFFLSSIWKKADGDYVMSWDS